MSLLPRRRCPNCQVATVSLYDCTGLSRRRPFTCPCCGTAVRAAWPGLGFIVFDLGIQAGFYLGLFLLLVAPWTVALGVMFVVPYVWGAAVSSLWPLRSDVPVVLIAGSQQPR